MVIALQPGTGSPSGLLAEVSWNFKDCVTLSPTLTVAEPKLPMRLSPYAFCVNPKTHTAAKITIIVSFLKLYLDIVTMPLIPILENNEDVNYIRIMKLLKQILKSM